MEELLIFSSYALFTPLSTLDGSRLAMSKTTFWDSFSITLSAP